MARKTDVEKLQARIAADLERLERAKLENDPRLAPVKEVVNKLRADRNKAKIEGEKIPDRLESKYLWIAEIEASARYYELVETNSESRIERLQGIDPDSEDIEGDIQAIMAEDEALSDALQAFENAREARKSHTQAKKSDSEES
jgi:hypothetical protein